MGCQPQELISRGPRTLRPGCICALAEARDLASQTDVACEQQWVTSGSRVWEKLVSKPMPSKKGQRSAPFTVGFQTHRTAWRATDVPSVGPAPWPSLPMPPCLAHSLALRFTVNLHESLLGKWILPDSGDRCCRRHLAPPGALTPDSSVAWWPWSVAPASSSFSERGLSCPQLRAEPAPFLTASEKQRGVGLPATSMGRYDFRQLPGLVLAQLSIKNFP